MTANPNNNVGVLKVKLKLAQNIADEAKAKGDARWQDVQAQADSLQRQIDVKESGAKPPPVVVELQPLHMKVQRLGLGR